MKIKTGDNVVVITGKNKSMTGKVMKVLLKSNKVVVEGVNKVTRHVKKTKERAGQKIQFEAPIHVSNVMLIDPKDKKRSKIGYAVDSKGKKSRISKKSNTQL
ncbi:50S ribosomal protein L24 [Candidatus Peregrinibacteria bacterium]|jgi:large subunit ribosomal protein L24|nr:50S ribosomal protein L24 [Candidatus Peregrinibacteria bacterium]MBT4631632.1 50S ribosomal protein L24 [Candidatus Peregrinibacteria bacterium]MBT5516760.1 50S ribosomal protein L24 [Candidatus Peregrinibacteria bacterium]MBT5823958.1 50S ribosomal protein L24 [Candidatus Peregrinibacteria bacterium]